MTTLTDAAPDLRSESEEPEDYSSSNGQRTRRWWRRIQWSRVAAYGLLPALALLLAMAAGGAKWASSTVGDDGVAGTAAMQAATSGTVALLSYKSDTVQQDLDRARDLLTGSLRDSYTKLVHDVVIPGAQRNKVATVITVPAAAPVSASTTRAVVLVFVDQTVTVGNDPPSSSTSTVRVSLDKIENRWLISQFEPV